MILCAGGVFCGICLALQTDLPADWIYAALISRGGSRGSGRACSYSPGPRSDISYQIWLHERPSTAAQSTSCTRPASASPGLMHSHASCAGAAASPGSAGLRQSRSPTDSHYPSPGSSNGIRSAALAATVQAAFCLATGEDACRFMWYRALGSWAADVPGAIRMVMGTVPAASSCDGAAAHASSPPAPGARVAWVSEHPYH